MPPKQPPVANEQQRAPNGQFGEGDGTMARPKAGILARLGTKVDALANRIPVLHQIKDAGKRVTSSIHAGLEARYGPKVAGAIMGGGFLGGYGVAGAALKLFAFPGVPLVNDVVAIGVLAGAAEVGLQARRAWGKLTGNEDEAGRVVYNARLDGVDVEGERDAVVEQLAGLVWKLMRRHKHEIAQALDHESVEIVKDAKAELKG